MTRKRSDEDAAALIVVGCLWLVCVLASIGLIGAIIWGIVALVLHFT